MARQQTKAEKDLLTQARNRWASVVSATSAQEKRERDDLAFYQGDGQWPDDVLRARQGGNDPTSGLPPVPGRPTLTINNLRAPVRQILNQESQADMGIELVAADDFGGDGGAGEDEIEVREGLVRRIQRESDAKDARRWAFSRAVEAGQGYYRVLTQYLPGKTFDQDIIVQRIYNQNNVKLDPAHEQPDGSDCEWEFISTVLSPDAFRAEYPGAKVPSDSDPDFEAMGTEAQDDWYPAETGQRDGRNVRVTEYYYTERVSRTLYDIDGQAVYADELPDGEKPKGAKSRTVIEKAIKWCKMTGLEILEETDWPSPYMPIIKVTGEEMHPWDEQRRIEGVVRAARDGCQGYNYMVSKLVEQVGLTPIPPMMLAAGQDEGFEKEYQLAATRTLPVLHYKQVDAEGRQAPPPFRTPVDTQVQHLTQGVALFGTSIQNVTSVPDPALGHIDPALKSGKAVQALVEQSKLGTSGFLENLRRSIEYEAKIINSLLPVIYDRPGRLARMLQPNGDAKQVSIGQPQQPGQAPAGPQAPGPKPTGPQVVTLTKDVNFNVAIKITKAYDTRRQEQAEQLAQIIQADPQLMTVFGDLLFRYQDTPGHQELSDRMKLMLDPRVQSALDGQQPVPPQLLAQMQQGQQMIQALSQQLEQAKDVIKTKQVETQADLQKAQMDNDTKITVALIQASAATAQTDAKLDAENARTFIDAEQRGLSDRLNLHLQNLHHAADKLHDRQTQLLDHAHERAVAATQQAHAADQAGQDRAHEANQAAQDAAFQAAQAQADRDAAASQQQSEGE